MRMCIYCRSQLQDNPSLAKPAATARSLHLTQRRSSRASTTGVATCGTLLVRASPGAGEDHRRGGSDCQMRPFGNSNSAVPLAVLHPPRYALSRAFWAWQGYGRSILTRRRHGAKGKGNARCTSPASSQGWPLRISSLATRCSAHNRGSIARRSGLIRLRAAVTGRERSGESSRHRTTPLLAPGAAQAAAEDSLKDGTCSAWTSSVPRTSGARPGILPSPPPTCLERNRSQPKLVHADSAFLKPLSHPGVRALAQLGCLFERRRPAPSITAGQSLPQ